jgi:hypothetical protein
MQNSPPSHDRNPIVEIRVGLDFDGSGHEPGDFAVGHRARDNATYYRGDQYDNIDTWGKPGYQDWYWRGTYSRDHSKVMTGHAYHNRQGWFYEEIQTRNGRQTDVMTSRCYDAS